MLPSSKRTSVENAVPGKSSENSAAGRGYLCVVYELAVEEVKQPSAISSTSNALSPQDWNEVCGRTGKTEN
jgi:hypothetical protein